jgi:hypothetical protein
LDGSDRWSDWTIESDENERQEAVESIVIVSPTEKCSSRARGREGSWRRRQLAADRELLEGIADM